MASLRKRFCDLFADDLPDYGVAVLHQWRLLIGGAIVSGLLMVPDMGVTVPGWAWWVAILVTLHIAQFLAWRDMRAQRDRLRRLTVSHETLADLAAFRSKIISAQNESVETDAEFGAWWERYKTLRAEIIKCLHDNVSPAEASLFDRVGTFEYVFFPGDDGRSMKYVGKRSRMVRDHRWLEDFLRERGHILSGGSAEK